MDPAQPSYQYQAPGNPVLVITSYGLAANFRLDMAAFITTEDAGNNRILVRSCCNTGQILALVLDKYS